MAQRIDLRQVGGDRPPGLALVAADPDLAAGGARGRGRADRRASAQKAWRLTVNQPCSAGKPPSCRVQLLPPSRVAIDRRPPARTDPRPDIRAVHGEHPGGVGVARVGHDGEADVADLCRHGLADPRPVDSRAVEAIDAAVVLLPDPVGVGGRERDEVGVLAELRIGIGQEVGLDAPVQRRPAGAPGHGSRTPRRWRWPGTCGPASRGSTTIWLSRAPSGVPPSGGAHCQYIGCSLKPATLSQVSPSSWLTNRPGGEVPAHQTPGSLAWPGSSQKVWLTARAVAGSSDFGNAGGRAASFQVAPASSGAEDGRAEVPGLGRHQPHLGIARIGDEVVDDLAEEDRPLGAPVARGRRRRDRPRRPCGCR